MIKCRECGYECSAANALGYHLRSHGMTYVDYVVKHDHGGVWPTCKCGKRLELKKGGFGRFCGKSCASSGDDNAMGRLKGEMSPNYGKVRTPEQLVNYSEGSRKRWKAHGEQLRTMMQTPEYREAQTQAQRESWKSSTTRREQTRDSLGRFWSSDSELTHRRRREASDRAIALLQENKIGPRAPFKQMWVDNPFTGQAEYMHSSWETAFLMSCVSEGYPVTKQHGIVIDYQQADGSWHRYLPDFKALEENVLFEVKGNLTANDELKLRAAEALGYEIVLVREVELEEVLDLPFCMKPSLKNFHSSVAYHFTALWQDVRTNSCVGSANVAVVKETLATLKQQGFQFPTLDEAAEGLSQYFSELASEKPKTITKAMANRFVSVIREEFKTWDR